MLTPSEAEMHRPKRFRLNSAHVIGVIALFVALGGTTWAGVQLGKGTVKARNLAKDAVTTKKIKNGAVTAEKIAPGVIPSVSLAMEPVHRVGGAGEPTFQNNWVNEGGGFEEAGFYKDPFGIVHLVGDVHGGTDGDPIFTLPPGYRPDAIVDSTVRANGDTGDATVAINFFGEVEPFGYVSNRLQLNGITFRAR